MRKILLIIIGVILIFVVIAYLNKTNNLHSPAKISDTLKTESILDTLERKKVKTDSIEYSKAIGNLTFGISEKQFNKDVKKFLKNHAQKGGYFYNIGDYVFTQVEPYYYNKKLYKVILRGESVDYENYKSTTQAFADAIIKTLTAKYGPPVVDHGLIERYRTEKNYWYLISEWQISGKTIAVRVTDEGINYTINVVFYQSDKQAEIDKNEQSKQDSTAVAAKRDL